jgi:PucR C-terminal helix-turn-helix domain
VPVNGGHHRLQAVPGGGQTYEEAREALTFADRLDLAGDVATEAARRLHVSVRTVTYRPARVAQLTGHRVAQPDQRFRLHLAVLGARLLDWPTRPLPTDP